MAKKKDKTLGYVLIGLAAYLLLQQRQAPQYQQFPQVPPAPSSTKGQAFSQWVNSILAIYGNVQELWQPGGPFYSLNPADVEQAVQDQNNSSPYSYNQYDFAPYGQDVLV